MTTIVLVSYNEIQVLKIGDKSYLHVNSKRNHSQQTGICHQFVTQAVPRSTVIHGQRYRSNCLKLDSKCYIRAQGTSNVRATFHGRKTDDGPTFRFFYGETDKNLVSPWRKNVHVLVHSSVHGVRFVKKCN